MNKTNSFKICKAPDTVKDDDKIDYVALHFWDNFTQSDTCYLCDSIHINGVTTAELKNYFGEYSFFLSITTDKEKSLSRGFHQFEKFNENFPDSKALKFFTDQLTDIFYNPDSIYYNEDIYFLLVNNMLESPLTSEDDKFALEYDAKVCGKNRVGATASNIEFKDINNKPNSLYQIETDWIILLFSNPTCNDCAETIAELANNDYLNQLINKGKLSIVNIYIDQDLDSWRNKVKTYPKKWICGYDYNSQVRNEISYNIRKMPTLFLLDKAHIVRMKNHPIEGIANYLENH